ncbi:lasso peptide biosynthesis B2 protein [Brevundimonas diminuta]|uniref:lasso peptide biosynthesis B2 protein n=1 Tax=Brevundimonas diminuta TaxID=293 RepID=UPI00320B6C85
MADGHRLFTMMISPAPSIHIASIEDDLVALDLENDAYFCLPGLAQHLVAEGDGRWTAANAVIANGLLETGLFQSAVSRPPMPAVTPTVRTSRLYEGRGSGKLAGMTLAAIMAREAWRIHGHALKVLLARSPNLPLRHDQVAEAMADARLFDRWMPWVPGQGQCLYRAYLLRAFLASRGRGATWMFGVRTWPFSAHCWLQVGDVLLDDDLDRVGLYTPIMAVGA